MNFLDKAIGVFSPGWALKRVSQRATLQLAQRSYDAARLDRRTSGWGKAATSGNAEIGAGAGRARNLARNFVRNNPHAKRAKSIYVANMVGTGIVPSPNTGNKKRDAALTAAFEAWCEQADNAGILDFYGLQALAAGGIMESGEVLARYRDYPMDKSGVVPMRLQLLEPDFIDSSRYGALGALPGNYINQGIEIDIKTSRRVAYWLWSKHPGDNSLVAQPLLSSRIPAEQVSHVFPAHIGRPGDIRGVTGFAAVTQRLGDLGDFEDAALLAKKIQACIAAFVKSTAGASSPLATTSTDGANPPHRLEQFAPGMVEYLQPGEDVEFFSPTAISDYAPFTGGQLHAIAAGLNVTYEDLTGDLSGTNYSSYRAGHLAFRRAIEMDQWLMLIPLFCKPVWRRFVDRCALAGIIDRPNYAVDWSTPKFESVDPMKDAQADRDDVRSGFVALPEVIRRRGYNPEKTLKDTADALKLARDLGLVLDTDGSLTNMRGSAAPPDDPANPGAKPNETEQIEQK